MARATGGALLSTVEIDRRSPVPYYRQLESAIRSLILNGDLATGTRLPATRQLAKDLDVSRLTVKNVYEQLIAEEFLAARRGAGTFVARIATSELPPTVARPHPAQQPWQRLSRRVRIIGRTRAVTHLGGYRPFRPGVPALDSFPRRAWAAIYSRIARQSETRLLGYGPPGGLPELQRAIADHVRDHRGVQVKPEQIIITAGAQQAFTLIAFTLLNPGDVVWFEDPGHIAGRDAMRVFSADLRSVAIDPQGFDLDYARARHPRARMIFTTPSHQHPLGVTMSLNRRIEILEYAQRRHAWVIEDDYDSEFRYSGRALPAMQGLDQTGHVLYVGSFSKTLYPGLRLGYLIAPAALIDTFAAGQTLLSQSVSPILQRTLAQFIGTGAYNAHIRKMRSLYRTRRDMLVDQLRSTAADLLEVQPTDAGLHVVAWLRNKKLNDRGVARVLWDAGIDCLPVSIYCAKRRLKPGIMLGFACAPESGIPEAVDTLAKALRSVAPE